jgi:hypothetical protein
VSEPSVHRRCRCRVAQGAGWTDDDVAAATD